MHETFKIFLMAGAALILCAAVPATAGYQAQDYDLPAQALGDALRAVARSSGQSIIVPTDLVAGKRAPALKGEFSPEAALAQLLAGSGLTAHRVGDALVIQRIDAESAQDAQGTGEGAGDQSIVVTGTRIRGRAPAGASVITIDRAAIAQSGYATTQQVLQALPQNFGGGPNETTSITGRGNAEANATSGSAVNLRGLGPSSTLVLLDGERVAMAGISGRFVDISLIPTAIFGPERLIVLRGGRRVQCPGEPCARRILGLWWAAPGRFVFLRDWSGDAAGAIELFSWTPGRAPVSILRTRDSLMDCQMHQGSLICAQERSQAPARIVRVDLGTGQVEPLFEPNRGDAGGELLREVCGIEPGAGHERSPAEQLLQPAIDAVEDRGRVHDQSPQPVSTRRR